MSSSPTPPKGSVRSIISIFENQTITVDNEPVHLIRRAKSMVSLSERPPKRRPERIESFEPEKNMELVQIEQQIRHLQNNVTNTYKAYSRESHIYYQNQIIFILTDIANMDSKNSAEQKSESTEILKRLTKKLNALLPSGGTEQTVIKIVQPRIGVTVRAKPEEKRPISSPVSSPKVEEPVRKYEVQEEEDEADSAAVSVRTLKSMFEKNTNEKEGKREYGSTTIKKSKTFSGISDLKYVFYSQRISSDLESPRDDVDFTRAVQNSFSSRQLTHVEAEDEAEKEDMSQDSLSRRSSSGEESDHGRNGTYNADEELD